MALGAGYVNLGGEKRLFKRMDKFSPPFLLLFFALSGLRLNIPSLATAGVIGVAYFFVRIAGKYAGASSGAALCRADRPSSNIWASLSRLRPAFPSVLPCWANACCLPAEGTMLATIILSSAVLYELTGRPAQSLRCCAAAPSPALQPGSPPAGMADAEHAGYGRHAGTASRGGIKTPRHRKKTQKPLCHTLPFIV